jgi:hypothetical protein
MTYITDEDIEDEALRDVMQETDYVYASSELDALATGLSVDLTSIVTSPLHLKVKEFVLAVAYARRAELNIGLGNRVMDGKDVYAYKQYLYSKKAEDLASKITPAMLTGVATSGTWSASIPLSRG